MKRSTVITEPQECVTLRVEDCAVMLGVSMSAAYALIEQAFQTGSPFKVLRIGKVYRILKASFLEYLYGEGGE
ncbi:MAG: helix-turn-helix domain-containing protein [Oscillospiraceae bacterium]|nr:helix-turn-helix domain-containing protein [Oscillospiraceae bacterium]